MGGPTSLYSFYQNKLFDPLAPLLVLPEVVDPSLWWEGKHFYIEAERKYIFVNEGSVSGFTISYNTQVVTGGIQVLFGSVQSEMEGKIRLA